VWTADEAWWALALGVAGACIGSFVAALSVRWPMGRSVAQGRSACDACGATIRARDLVPVLSALALRGRCRDCAAPIAPIHWRVEVAAAAIGASAGLVAASPFAVAGAVFGWGLLALAVLDLTHWWLPDRLTLPLAIAGLALGPGMPVGRVIGGALGYAGLALVAAGYRRWRGREGLGGGDPKLLGAIGCWLGWAMLPAVLVIAGLVGLGAVAVLRLGGREVAGDTALPFGALMAAAAYPAWLAMIGWGT